MVGATSLSGKERITKGGGCKLVISEVFRVKKNDYWVPRGSAAVFFKADWRIRSDMTPIQNLVGSGFPNKMRNISICRQPLYMLFLSGDPTISVGE